MRGGEEMRIQFKDEDGSMISLADEVSWAHISRFLSFRFSNRRDEIFEAKLTQGRFLSGGL